MFPLHYLWFYASECQSLSGMLNGKDQWQCTIASPNGNAQWHSQRQCQIAMPNGNALWQCSMTMHKIIAQWHCPIALPNGNAYPRWQFALAGQSQTCATALKCKPAGHDISTPGPVCWQVRYLPQSVGWAMFWPKTHSEVAVEVVVVMAAVVVGAAVVVLAPSATHDFPLDAREKPLRHEQVKEPWELWQSCSHSNPDEHSSTSWHVFPSSPAS